MTSRLKAATENNRRAVEALSGSAAFADALRKATVSTAALSEALKAHVDRQQPFWDQWAGLSEQFKRATESIDSAQWSKFAESLKTLSSSALVERSAALAVAAVPGAGIIDIRPSTVYGRTTVTATVDIVASGATELPDGLEAIPLIFRQLSAKSRREFALRFATLMFATWAYIEALLASEGEARYTAWAVLANLYLWASVLSAIEEVETELAASVKPDGGFSSETSKL